MPCQVRWFASASTSAFHAAAAVDRGRKLIDASWTGPCSEAISRLLSLLGDLGLPRDLFWQHVIPLSARMDSNRQLADVVLRKIVSPATRPPQAQQLLAGAFTDLERAAVKAFPDLLEQLEQRAKPLRQQWEAHGPGLLLRIGRQTEEPLIVSQADVIAIHPVLGGGGLAHLAYNSVTIEAVLVNPHEPLPEVLRLAWMLAQLNNDLPMHSEMVHGRQLSQVSQLAMLPPVLAVAEQLDLARFDMSTLKLALEVWSADVANSGGLADTVIRWWETYDGSRPTWSVALTALARMIEPPSSTRRG
jgi:hypothetical protein